MAPEQRQTSNRSRKCKLRVVLKDMLPNEKIAPNSSHPLNDLSPTERERERVRNMAELLARIAMRQTRTE